MRSALDLADAGLKVYLVEHTPGLGGRVAQLGYMFPQHDCVLCRGTPDHGYGCTRPSISPAYITHNQHPNIEILTNTHVLEVEGQAGDFSVSLKQEPRYVDPAKCINCGYCANVCPVFLPDEYQQGITMRKAIYKVSARAAPDAYVIDFGPYCENCTKCTEVCPSKAIDLHEKPRLRSIEVGAIILAVGFQIFDPTALGELGYKRYPNVISAMEYERLVSRSGPSEGIVMRPSDKQQPKKIAWLQCIGSRDQTNSYCSSICCMFATKEAILAKQRLGDQAECTIFIMDERAFNKEYSTYFDTARNKHKIQYRYCRVSEIKEDPSSQNLILSFATPDGKKSEELFDLVVLATGLRPPETANQLADLLGIELNQYGFCQTDKFTPLQSSRPGVFVCGAFSSPKEIAETILDASGAAAEVMRLLNDQLNTHEFSREWPFLTRNNLIPEKDISNQPIRIGILACKCGGTLGENLKFTDLVEKTKSWPDVVHSEAIDFACFPESVEHLKELILDKDLNRIVIAGCSNRTHESLFHRTMRETGLNPYLLEMVNLREQCANVHQWQSQLANQKALEMIRVAVGRVKQAKPVHKEKHNTHPVALIIGGGLSGMVSALAIADSGCTVHLIERAEMLGGNLNNLFYVAEGYNPQRLLRDLINRVRSHQNILVHTRSELVRHRGHVGFFSSTVQTRVDQVNVEQFQIDHGVTIVATGGQEFRQHPLLDVPGVITQRTLEENIIHHPEQIAALHDVVMLQCVGPEGVANYCSRVCCTTTIKNAIRIKLYNPKCRVTILYKNIVTYGFREEYYEEARRLGIIFIRFTDNDPPKVMMDKASPKLSIQIKDPALGKTLLLPADIVPLSMSVVPSPDTDKLAEMLRVPLSSEGFFAEAQTKLRPMDFMREGIFLAGMAAYPKFVEESITHSLATAARALTLLTQDSLYLGGVVAYVDPERCVGCLTCTRVCPFSIPQVVQKDGQNGVGGLGHAAYIDTAQCQGCGTCTGECPANAIQLVHFTDEQMMLREIGGLGAWQTSPVTG